jgi:hypothetical protein
VPDAHRWAMQFSREQHVPLKRFLGSAAPAILRIAVIAIANSWIVDRDTALRDLLERVIAETDGLAAEEAPSLCVRDLRRSERVVRTQSSVGEFAVGPVAGGVDECPDERVGLTS